MGQPGRVTAVSARTLSASLAVDASSADTSITVDDPSVFNSEGGTAVINPADSDTPLTVTYTAVAGAVLTLSAALGVDVPASSLVTPDPATSLRVATVTLGGDESHGSVEAVIEPSVAAHAMLGLGVLAQAVSVWVEDGGVAGYAYTVSRMLGYEPAIDGDALADGTITETKIADDSISTPKLAANAIDGMVITGAIVQTSATAPRTAMESDKFLSQNAEGTSVEVQDGSFRAFNDYGEASISYIGDSSFSGLGILSGSGINESDELVDGGPITSTATQHNWSLPGATGDDGILPGQMVLDRDNGLTVATNGDWPLFRKILTLHMDSDEAFTSGNYRYPVVGLDDAVLYSGSDTVALEWMEYLSDLTGPYIKIYKSGLYRVWWRPVWQGNTSGHRYAAIEVNGTITDRDTRTPGGTTTSFRQDLTVERWFDADDVIRFTAMQNAGSINMIGNSGGYRTTAGIEYLGYNPSA